MRDRMRCIKSMDRFSSEDEGRLIESARGGSREAFTALLRIHQSRLRSYLGRYVRDRGVVDDLAQETFLSAYQSLPSYRDEVPFRIWILGIGRHRALRHLREEQRRRSRESALFRGAVAGWLADEIESAEPRAHDLEVEALRSCIEALPERSAALVTEYYFRRRSGVQIARAAGKSGGAVWMTLLRVRQALRRCVESKLSTEGAGP
jgi:RNA polymerase sigma-70 factor (ECF subfamily)